MRSFNLATPLVFTCVLSSNLIEEVIRDSRTIIESVNGTLTVETRNGINRLVISFPSANGTLKANCADGLISLEHTVDARPDRLDAALVERISTEISVPFTPLHSFVQARAPRPVVPTKIDLTSGPNCKLVIALQREPNMRVYLHGAHARAKPQGTNQAVSIAPRNVLYNIVLSKVTDNTHAAIALEIQERSSGRVLESWTHKRPGDLHRQLTELLTLAKAHKAKEFSHAA